jgi:hypothetical protein
MSNLIPSLETFAKAGRPSVRSFPLSVFCTHAGRTHPFSALLRGFFSSGIFMARSLMVVYIGDGCDCRGIGHAGSVFIRLLVLLTPFETLPAQEWDCSTMDRTSSYTPAHSLPVHGKVSFPHPLPRSVLTGMCDPPYFCGRWFALINGQTSPSRPTFQFRTRTLNSPRQTMSKSGRSCCCSGTC